MNLKYMKVSLFEISYNKKWTFSRHSNSLRCTCIVHSSTENSIDWDLRIDIGSEFIKIENFFLFYPALAYFVVVSGLRCHCSVEHEKWSTVSVHLFSSEINKCISICSSCRFIIKKWKCEHKKSNKCVIIWRLKWWLIIDYDRFFSTQWQCRL